ncbi:MFS transporter [Brevibacillus laterosporus]|uniref:MFS transporter n=1 Tax=Brevibacillus laterosporus TaxID=1465 RepID=UPI000376D9FB|nr:MFS transporter [Brevibacillus laterosporus]ATO48962.1 MFS transporter [Brevibacillus laterosporus DSM 25]MBG9803277.1 MFS transporter [Brevibacillus laterosporus]MED2001865.1 MFS transporter [Brevibacillus laterosporus]MED4765961.1 MFS transporter [Brevibacillus laterosporus]TPH09166.1 MFS transporter [Brevibacillus laterosporus]
MDIIRIFKNKNYTYLFLANVTSSMGNKIGLIAFTLYILTRFSSQPIFATITELMYSLPMLVIFLFIGAVADRFDRKKIASWADFICAFLSLGLLFAIAIDSIVLSFFIIFVRSAVSNFFSPAQRAIMQGILTEKEYPVATGLNQMVNSILILVGSSISIFLYWHIGIEGAILVDAISYLVSGLLIQLCHIKVEIRLPNGEKSWKDVSIGALISDFSKGVGYIWNNKLVLAISSAFFLFGIINAGYALIPTYALKYKLAPESYETVLLWMGIVSGVGALFGSVVGSYLATKMKLYHIAVLSLMIMGISVVFSGLTNNVSIFILLDFFISLAFPLLNIGFGGWLPSLVDPKIIGRVYGCLTPMMMLSHSITLGIIAVTFPVYIGVSFLFFIHGTCMLLAAIFYYYIFQKNFANKRVVEQQM